MNLIGVRAKALEVVRDATLLALDAASERIQASAYGVRKRAAHVAAFPHSDGVPPFYCESIRRALFWWRRAGA